MITLIKSESAEETEKIGEEFSKTLSPGRVVCLYGELGAGKTTFTKGVARGLGIESRVISPTFSLVRQYKIDTRRSHTFYHLDLYRLESSRDVRSIGIEDILSDSGGIVLIEWPEKMGSLLPKERIDIHISETDGKREIRITTV